MSGAVEAFSRAIVNVGNLGIQNQPFSRNHEAAGKLSGESRREGASQNTLYVSGRAQGVRQPILYHKYDGRNGKNLSHEGLVGNRRQAGAIAEHARGEAKIPFEDELFRAAGGIGWAGEIAFARGVARSRSNHWRSGRSRDVELSRSDKPHASAG